MTKFLNLILFLCITSFTFGQTAITGKVVDSASNSPIANASIYINNSSTGTTTNQEGEFTLLINFTGQVDLVISYVGYKRRNVHFNTSRVPNQLLVVLTRQSNILNEVTISGGKSSGWKKWQELFTKYFIGDLDFAKKCKILNPEVLVFRYDKPSNKLKVTARSTLMIENKALGYVYKVDLNNFDYSFKTLLVSSDVATFFENIKPVDAAEQNTFLANRKYAFNGSKMHFIQSLYQKDYSREGFAVIAVHLKKDPEKVRIDRLLSVAVAKAFQQNENPNTVTLASVANNNRDTITYYQEKLALPEFVIKDTTSIALGEYITPDRRHQNARFHLKDTLFVEYSENHDDKAVSFEMPGKGSNFSISDKNIIYSKKTKSRLQYSMILLASTKEITIYPNGGYEGNDLLIKGYMADQKMAYQLPWDYKVTN